jgi:2,5-dihydroxypyridine 5,6-dioxygenase
MSARRDGTCLESMSEMQGGTEDYRRGATVLVAACAGLRRGERAYIVSEPATRDVAGHVARVAAGTTEQVRHDTIEGAAMHGAEPPEAIARRMADADVVFCLTRASMAHTQARRRATDAGTRFLSLPDYSLELLGSASLQADFEGLRPQAEQLAARLSAGSRVRIRSARGTELSLVIASRTANSCPGVCHGPGSMASPPDAEVNIAPVEGTAEGTAWIDGSIPCPGIGLVAAPVRLAIRKGRIEQFTGPEGVVAQLESVFRRAEAIEPHVVASLRDANSGLGETGPRADARLLAEFGVGLNPAARLTGRMLEDEGCAGTIHLGFGSNATIGGRNRVAFHLDFVIRAPSVWIDEELFLKDGVLQLADQAPRKEKSCPVVT